MGFCPFNLLVIWYFFHQRCGAILIVVFFDLSYLDAKKYENKDTHNGYTIFWKIETMSLFLVSQCLYQGLKFPLTALVFIHENVSSFCPL